MRLGLQGCGRRDVPASRVCSEARRSRSGAPRANLGPIVHPTPSTTDDSPKVVVRVARTLHPIPVGQRRPVALIDVDHCEVARPSALACPDREAAARRQIDVAGAVEVSARPHAEVAVTWRRLCAMRGEA